MSRAEHWRTARKQNQMFPNIFPFSRRDIADSHQVPKGRRLVGEGNRTLCRIIGSTSGSVNCRLRWERQYTNTRTDYGRTGA
jgi:hypothetical protein